MAHVVTPNPWEIADQKIEDLKASGDVVLSEDIGVANGVAGLDADGNIVATPIHRFGTASAINAIVLKDGEIAFTTDTLEWRRGDGSTLGGLFFASQPVAYVGGPTELTSTSADGITITHAAVASAVYRIWGDVGFSGDSDLQSNFRLLMSYTSGDTSLILPQSSMHAFMTWISRDSTGILTPDLRFFIPATNSIPVLSATPINTTATSGSVRIDAMLATNAAANISIGMRLRAAKVGTPTIVAAYRLFIQRVK